MLWPTFWGIFGGMIASAIVGAISLLMIKFWDNFIKRKEMVNDIGNELKLNLENLYNMKELIIENIIFFKSRDKRISYSEETLALDKSNFLIII